MVLLRYIDCHLNYWNDTSGSCRVWKLGQDLQLADSAYLLLGSIHLFLGANILPSLFLNDKRIDQTGEPMALETLFGWVLVGLASINQLSNQSFSVSIFEILDLNFKQSEEHE